MATNRHLQRGDTLIEVLMSIVILSIVIVGSITLMTRGLASAQIAVEHTQVRLAINSQSEMLRFLRDGYVKDANSQAGQRWTALVTGAYVNLVTSTYDADNCAITTGKTPFYLEEAATGQVEIKAFDQSQTPDAAAQAGKGLWVEATRSPAGITPGYIDFQLRACWQGGGSDARQQTVTAVRLYDPSN